MNAKLPNIKYVFLVRHGARDNAYNRIRIHHHLQNIGYNTPKIGDYYISDRKISGLPKTISLAGWFAETFQLYNIGEIVQCICSPHKHSIETAQTYLEVLDLKKKDSHEKVQEIDISDRIENKDFLTPNVFWDMDKNKKKEYIKFIKGIKTDKDSSANAIMICGHQPQLTWIANDILNSKYIKPIRYFFYKYIVMRKDIPLPLAQSEVACLQLYPRKQLLWAIAEENKDIENKLYEKIKSKMDVAKFFSGFISILLSFILANIGSIISSGDAIKQNLFFGGSIFIILSLGLCIKTMFLYDQLLMPSIFWAGKPFKLTDKTPKCFPRRPPTQKHWTLFFSMIHTWKYFFTTAVLFYYTGINFILVAYLCTGIYVYYLYIIIPLLFIFFFMIIRSQSSLGFDD